MTKCSKCNMVHQVFKNGKVKKTCPKKCPCLKTGVPRSGFSKNKKGGFSNPLTVRPKHIKELINKLGSKKITFIKICRQPIIETILKAYKLVAGNKLAATKKKYNYDQIFHLYMILYLDDGRVVSTPLYEAADSSAIRIEKNERVSVKYNYTENDQAKDCTPKVKANGITIKQLIEEYEKVGSWRYDAEISNCQYFVKDMSNILGVFAYDSFIKQKLEGVLPRYASVIANMATDASALLDYAIHGGGFSSMQMRPPVHILPVPIIRPTPRYIK